MAFTAGVVRSLARTIDYLCPVIDIFVSSATVQVVVLDIFHDSNYPFQQRLLFLQLRAVQYSPRERVLNQIIGKARVVAPGIGQAI